MHLRKLKIKDAPFMLEWMHDDNVVCDLLSNFKSKTLDDCLWFIKHSSKDKNNLHLAIVSETDEYMGTVSLKQIDREKSRAEFAIAIRRKAMGHGFSWFAMHEIFKIGFSKESLNTIYWCVSKQNVRACKFYDKHKFNEYLNPDEELLSDYEGISNLKWYFISKTDFQSNVFLEKDKLIKVVNIKTILTEKDGQLSFVEGSRDIPFDIKRIYYLTNVNEGSKRGYHAHKKLKQLLFCPYGKINILVDDGKNRGEILLENPSIGILIEKPLWREMVWIESNSVLMVLASDYYSEEDYIRSYDGFIKYQKSNN